MTGDNGINRRGQKVECIIGVEVVNHRGKPLATPQPGKVYTVDDFLLSGKLAHGAEQISEEATHPGISLIEIPTATCECCGKMLGWPIVCFRPIVHPDTKADLSAIVDAAAKVTLPKREDAKAFFQGGVVTLSSWPVLGERPGETLMPLSSLLTPRQLADLQGFAPAATDQRMQAAIDRAAEDIARAFIRAYVIPLLVKRLGL